MAQESKRKEESSRSDISTEATGSWRVPGGWERLGRKETQEAVGAILVTNVQGLGKITAFSHLYLGTQGILNSSLYFRMGAQNLHIRESNCAWKSHVSNNYCTPSSHTCRRVGSHPSHGPQEPHTGRRAMLAHHSGYDFSAWTLLFRLSHLRLASQSDKSIPPHPFEVRQEPELSTLTARGRKDTG